MCLDNPWFFLQLLERSRLLVGALISWLMATIISTCRSGGGWGRRERLWRGVCVVSFCNQNISKLVQKIRKSAHTSCRTILAWYLCSVISRPSICRVARQKTSDGRLSGNQAVWCGGRGGWIHTTDCVCTLTMLKNLGKSIKNVGKLCFF